MSDRQMTGAELAALSFRILGVVILLSGLAQSVFLLLGVAQSDWSPWNLLGLFATLVFLGAVALPLLFYSEWLAAWLFPKSDKTIAVGVSRRDLLMCGLALIGAWLLAGNLPYLARFATEILWNAEGTRRFQVSPELLSRTTFGALGSAFTCVAGWLLFRYSGRIADWWEERAQGEARRP